jgi:hypothetical protein
VSPVLAAVRETNRRIAVNGENIVQYFAKTGVKAPMIDPHALIVGCDVLHPQNHSCVKHNFSVFMDTARKILPLYSSIACVPVVIFKFREIFKKPIETATGVGVNIARSVSFISAFVALYMTTICLHRKVATRDNKYIYFFAGIVCSFSVFLEKKSRRSELALYTLPRAMDSLYLIMCERKWLQGVQNGELYLFMFSMGCVMYFYERFPNSLSSLLHSFLYYLQ